MIYLLFTVHMLLPRYIRVFRTGFYSFFIAPYGPYEAAQK